jgi:hypothetical protein
MWRSPSPEQAMEQLNLNTPAVSAPLTLFFHNANRTDWNTGKPIAKVSTEGCPWWRQWRVAYVWVDPGLAALMFMLLVCTGGLTCASVCPCTLLPCR